MVCDGESKDKNTSIADLLTTDEGLLPGQNAVLCLLWQESGRSKKPFCEKVTVATHCCC